MEKEIFLQSMQELEDCMKSSQGVYRFPAESRRCGQRVERSREELIEYLTRLTGEYPISLLEDPLYREKIRKACRSWKKTGRSGGL